MGAPLRIIKTVKDPDYKTAFAFMEGFMQTRFNLSGVFTEADRIEMHQKIKKHYGVDPISPKLKSKL